MSLDWRTTADAGLIARAGIGLLATDDDASEAAIFGAKGGIALAA